MNSNASDDNMEHVERLASGAGNAPMSNGMAAHCMRVIHTTGSVVVLTLCYLIFPVNQR
jgi:hypothetical protein